MERNRLYEAIEGSELDPAECELESLDDEVLIRHRSGSIVEIRRLPTSSDSAFRYAFKFGVVDSNRRFRMRRVQSIYDGMRDVQKWANAVKRESEIPDLWAEMKANRDLLTDIQHEDVGNTPFTQDERDQIAAQLQAIKEQVKEQYALTGEQISQVEERLDETADASTRMGRKDWLLLFGGTVFNLIVTDTVTPGVAGHIFTTVVQGIAHLFGAGGPPQILT